MPYQPAPYHTIASNEGYWQKTQRFLQELSFEYTFLYGKQSDPSDFGWNRVELSSTFAFPMFYNIETPLLVTPGFAFNFLEGPVSGPPIVGPPPMAGGPDLPPRVYDAYLDFAWYPRCYEWLGGELGFRTGVWTDFDNVDSDSLRFLGRAVQDHDFGCRFLHRRAHCPQNLHRALDLRALRSRRLLDRASECVDDARTGQHTLRAVSDGAERVIDRAQQ